jgi:glucose/arabinose dehydrogenase
VVHIPFRNGRPSGGYDDFVLGWAPDPKEKTVWGRPAGLLVLRDGSLLVSDDGAGVLWRISYGE